MSEKELEARSFDFGVNICFPQHKVTDAFLLSIFWIAFSGHVSSKVVKTQTALKGNLLFQGVWKRSVWLNASFFVIFPDFFLLVFIVLVQRASLWSLLGPENIGHMTTGVVFLPLHISSEWIQRTPGEAKRTGGQGSLTSLEFSKNKLGNFLSFLIFSLF